MQLKKFYIHIQMGLFTPHLSVAYTTKQVWTLVMQKDIKKIINITY